MDGPLRWDNAFTHLITCFFECCFIFPPIYFALFPVNGLLWLFGSQYLTCKSCGFIVISHTMLQLSLLNKHRTGEESEAVPSSVQVSRRNSSLEKRKGQTENVKTTVLASPDRPCLSIIPWNLPPVRLIGRVQSSSIVFTDIFWAGIALGVRSSWMYSSQVETWIISGVSFEEQRAHNPFLKLQCMFGVPNHPEEKGELGMDAVLCCQLCELLHITLRGDKGMHSGFYEDTFDT